MSRVTIPLVLSLVLLGACQPTARQAPGNALPPGLLGTWVQIGSGGDDLQRMGSLALGREQIVGSLQGVPPFAVGSDRLVVDSGTGAGSLSLPAGGRLQLLPHSGLAKLVGAAVVEPTVSPALAVIWVGADGAQRRQWLLWPDTTVTLAEAAAAYHRALAQVRRQQAPADQAITGSGQTGPGQVRPREAEGAAGGEAPVATAGDRFIEHVGIVCPGYRAVAIDLVQAADRGPASFARRWRRFGKLDRYRRLQEQLRVRAADNRAAAAVAWQRSAQRADQWQALQTAVAAWRQAVRAAGDAAPRAARRRL